MKFQKETQPVGKLWSNLLNVDVYKRQKQYLITDAILFTNPDLFDIINRCDTVFVYDVPAASRTTIVEYCYANNKNIYYNFETVSYTHLRDKTERPHGALL